MSAEDEPRRALCAFETRGLPGSPPRGEGEAAVDDEGLSVGGVRVEFLDADSLADEARVVTLGVYPDAELRLSKLARRHETFGRALAEARDAARLRGLLAHGLGVPEVFEGCVLEPGPLRPARLFLYSTHLAVVPAGGDPFQLPLGGVTDLRFDPTSYQVALATPSGDTVFGRLARQTAEFERAVRGARAALLERCAAASGTQLFSDGRAVAARDLGSHFERLLASWSAHERWDGAKALAERAGPGNATLGLATLLDPDEETLAARDPLPANVAAFLLAPVQGFTVFELVSGPAAATYVFRAPLDDVAQDLAALHFRRKGLSLSEDEAAGPAGRPLRLALRRLEPLQRLRKATVARVLHTEQWAKAVGSATRSP